VTITDATLSAPASRTGTVGAGGPGSVLAATIRRRRRRGDGDSPDRGVLSSSDWRRRPVKYTWRTLHFAVLVLLVIWCLGPLVLLAKFAFTPTQDILTQPLAIFPNGPTLDNVDQAWNRYHIGHFFLNTVWVALGSWFSQILVATTGGFVLSVLRPRWSRALNWAVLATLFVPAVVLLVPLYRIIVDPPIGPSLINNYLAVWLPAGATAFNVVLVARFFDALPREIFEAAQIDGAGGYRLFWSIVLPMSRPIIGVVSVFAVIASWKDFLWPFLVLKSDSVKPLSVYLQSMANVDKGTLMAALAISTTIPIVMFLVFQRMFLRGAGLGGAVKG
jgi:multiple sugar transport system permease protein